jgi:hypothetical protein
MLNCPTSSDNVHQKRGRLEGTAIYTQIPSLGDGSVSFRWKISPVIADFPLFKKFAACQYESNGYLKFQIHEATRPDDG